MDYAVALQSLSDQFFLDYQLHPMFGAELEFYLQPTDIADNISPDDASAHLLQQLNGALQARHQTLYDAVQERAPFQYEVAIDATIEPHALLAHIEDVKTSLAEFAPQQHATLLWDAKPFADKPGSGMHLHVSLWNSKAENTFLKRDAMMSSTLRHALGGLLETLPESMVIFAPKPESYARFDGSDQAPNTISWGANNRTTALRLPASRDGRKHIEHRVPGADADAAQCLLAMLAAIHHGLNQQSEPGPQIFGDAHKDMYGLQSLPTTYAEALALFKGGNILPDYFGEGWNAIAK